MPVLPILSHPRPGCSAWRFWEFKVVDLRPCTSIPLCPPWALNRPWPTPINPELIALYSTCAATSNRYNIQTARCAFLNLLQPCGCCMVYGNHNIKMAKRKVADVEQDAAVTGNRRSSRRRTAEAEQQGEPEEPRKDSIKASKAEKTPIKGQKTKDIHRNNIKVGGCLSCRLVYLSQLQQVTVSGQNRGEYET